MLRKDLAALVIGVAFVGYNIAAFNFFTKKADTQEERSLKYWAGRWAEPVLSEEEESKLKEYEKNRKAKEMEEYRQRVASFNQAADQKRIEVKTAVREDEINARQDLKDVEKDALLTCFYFHEDNYAQVDFSYKNSYENKNPECDQKIRNAVLAGSKEPDIVNEYRRIVAKEAEIARIAMLDLMINNLGLPREHKDLQDTANRLLTDFNLFKEVLQRLKRKPWVVYRMVGQPLRGNLVYPGLFKPYIDESKVTEEDARIIGGLTYIVNSYDLGLSPNGKLPKEPSYAEQKAAGLDPKDKIGEGCSVAWALLRYALFSQYVIQNSSKLTGLTPLEKAKVVDDLIIRCGDRETNTVARDAGSECGRWIDTLMPLLKERKVKVVDTERSMCARR